MKATSNLFRLVRFSAKATSPLPIQCTIKDSSIVQYFVESKEFKILFESNSDAVHSVSSDLPSNFEECIIDIEPTHVIQKQANIYEKPPKTIGDELPIATLEKGTKIYSIQEVEKGEWRHVIVAPSLWVSQNKRKKDNKKGTKRTIQESEDNSPTTLLTEQDSTMVDNQQSEILVGFIPSHYAGKINRKTIVSKVKEPTSSTEVSSVDTNNNEKSLHNEVIRGFDNKSNTYSFSMKSIGIFHSVFPTKNGCPRQFGLVDSSQGKLEITIPQGEMALEGLDKFSHCWIMFVFHENSLESNDKVKIRPPRMNGNGKVGIYATRSPHRPNGIGLSVAKIEKIEGNTVYMSGADLIDGTPVIDIKPYIGRYDSIPETRTPEWIQDDLFVQKIDESKISFSQQAESELSALIPKLEFYNSMETIKKAIIQVLQSDPRPVYMRKKKDEKLYGFRIDRINVRCKFGDDDTIEIVQVELWE